MNCNLYNRNFNRLAGFVRHQSKSSFQYCMDSVRQYDYENYMCTLLLKNTARRCAFAVRGFNVEVARVAEQVSQSNIGLMRLKFWEEAVDKCFMNDPHKVPEHPVASELFKAIQTMKLTKRYLKTLISSRADRLQQTTFANLEEIEKYADDTVSSVYYLILEGNGIKNVHADHAASHLGKAQGIVQQLRSAYFARRLNMIPLPQDILMKNKVRQEDILRNKSSEALSECAFEIASRAHQHLMKSKSLADKVPKGGRESLLPAVVVLNYLEKLQRVNYDIFHPKLRQRGWLWIPKVWITNLRNRY